MYLMKGVFDMKLRKIVLKVVAPLCLTLCLFSMAWAAGPEEALSARPEKSVYSVLRLEDLGGFLRWALSEENLKLIAAAPNTGLDEGTIQLVVAALSTVPVKEAALVVGQTDPKGLPFLQVALAVPAGAELDRLASGKGTAADLMTLVLGADNPLLAMLGGEAPFAMAPQDGNVYTLDDTLALAARDGLILLSLSMDDLKAGITALESGKDRLALKRRFDAKDFALLHADPSALEALSKAQTDENGPSEEDYKLLREVLRTPLEVELGFERFPERFLLSTGWNFEEAMAENYAAYFKKMMAAPRVPGGHITLLGEGSPIFALGMLLNMEGFADNPSPEIKQAWKELVEGLASLGVSERELADLLADGLSLVAGGRVPYEGFRIPGAYLALNGQAGAAASVLDKLAKVGEGALAPAQVEGWEKAYRVDPSAAPVPCVVGVKGETLFLGLAETSTLAGTPAPSPKLEELLKKESGGSLFFDFEGILSYLKDEFVGMSPMLAMITGDSSVMEHILEVLDAKLSVPSLSAWSPSGDMALWEFALADVPAEDGLLVRLIKAGSAIAEAAEKAEEK